MVVFDPDTGQVTRDLGPAKAPGIGGGKAVSGAKALENQIWEETLRILYSKGPGALTPMQIEMAKAKKLLDKDYGKPNIKEIVKDNMIILYDIDNQKIIQEIPFGNPVRNRVMSPGLMRSRSGRWSWAAQTGWGHAMTDLRT